MTRDEVVDLIKARVMRPNDTTLDSKIITEMKLFQTELEEGDELPYFLMDTLGGLGTLDTAADQDYVTLPASFIQEYGDGAQAAVMIFADADDYGQELIKEDLSPMHENYRESDDDSNETKTGKPVYYSIDYDGGSPIMRLRPIPDAVYGIEIRAYVRQTTLNTNVENNWLKHVPDLFINHVGAIIAENYLFNSQLADKLRGYEQASWKKMWRTTESKPQANNSGQAMRYGGGIT